MSKKSIIFIFNLLVLNTASIFSMSEIDKRAIRKELYSNYENDRINVATLSEIGLTLPEVIDRDIEILSEHRDLLQKKIDFCKSSYVRTFLPFFNKVGIVFTGGLSSVTGLFAIGGSQWWKKIYDGGGVQDRWYNWFVDKAADWEFISHNEYYKELVQRFQLKEKENPGFVVVGLAVPAAAAISIFSGLVFMSCLYNAYKYQGNVNIRIQKISERLKRDQAIIAQLKEIKHTLAI